MAAIVVGTVVVAILLSLSVYFLIFKLKKRRERDSYLDEKGFPTDPKELGSRLSSASRTGNATTIKFNPPKSSETPLPSRSALRQPKGVSNISSPQVESGPEEVETDLERSEVLIKARLSSAQAAWPLAMDLTFSRADPSKDTKLDHTDWPLNVRTAVPAPTTVGKIQNLTLLHTKEAPVNNPYLAPNPKKIFSKADQALVVSDENHIEDTIELELNVPDFDYLAAKRMILDPFGDETMEPRNTMAAKSLDTQRAEQERIKNAIKTPAQGARAQSKLLTNPFENSLPALAFRYFPDPSKAIINIPEDETFGVTKSMGNQRSSVLDLEQLLPEQSTRVPSPEVLALLSKDDQFRTSTVPEIDTLLRIVAQQNEDLADKPLFWSDFRPPDVEVEEAMSSTAPIQSSPLKQIIEGPKTPGETAGKLPPFLHGPVPDDSNLTMVVSSPNPPTQILRPPVEVQRDPSPAPVPVMSAKERDISPLHHNPQIRNISSVLVERGFAVPIAQREEPDQSRLTERGDRGRSMVRTSDLIEARLSYIAQMETMDEQAEEQLQKERMVSPLRRNPIDFSTLSIFPREETSSPLPRNPSLVLSEKRKSRTVSPPRSKLALVGGDARDRTESPLRRNPVDPRLFASIRDRTRPPLRRNLSTSSAAVERQSSLIALRQTLRSSSVPRPPVPSPNEPLLRFNPTNPQASRAKSSLETGLRPTSNAAFSQALSKFRTLAEQRPVEASQASTEVTQRAIAGIYIPGSLREQAVRNSSKSRERGKEVGSVSRSTSKSG